MDRALRRALEASPEGRAYIEAKKQAKTARSRRVGVKKAPRLTKEARAEAAARRNREKVYRAVDARSEGVCEFAASTVCCNDAEEHDHFWGRGKEEERPSTVWHLCKFHHDRKTRNEPSRLQWLRWFRDHCFRNDFREQMAKCDRAISLELAQHPPRSDGDAAPATATEETDRE